MFYNIKDIYIARIYSINNFDSGRISDSYAAFYREYDEKTNEYNYVLLNRGKLSKETINFQFYSIFQSIDSLDFNLDFSFFYIDDIKPITAKLFSDDIKEIVNLIDIHLYLGQINRHEKKKQKIKSR